MHDNGRRQRGGGGGGGRGAVIPPGFSYMGLIKLRKA